MKKETINNHTLNMTNPDSKSLNEFTCPETLLDNFFSEYTCEELDQKIKCCSEISESGVLKKVELNDDINSASHIIFDESRNEILPNNIMSSIDNDGDGKEKCVSDDISMMSLSSADNIPDYYGFSKELCPFEQKKKLINDTDNFFSRHQIRFKKHILPLKVPNGYRDLYSVAQENIEYPPFTTVYRHMYNLKKRILSNWSYICTNFNYPGHRRNQNIPFDLRSLNQSIINQVESISSDLCDSDFTGVLLTLHTRTFTHPTLPMQHPLSKVIGGALIEGLSSNERCIKALWIHPRINTYATRLLLQVFLLRVIMEAFLIEIDGSSVLNTEKNSKTVPVVNLPNPTEIDPQQVSNVENLTFDVFTEGISVKGQKIDLNENAVKTDSFIVTNTSEQVKNNASSIDRNSQIDESNDTGVSFETISRNVETACRSDNNGMEVSDINLNYNDSNFIAVKENDHDDTKEIFDDRANDKNKVTIKRIKLDVDDDNSMGKCTGEKSPTSGDENTQSNVNDGKQFKEINVDQNHDNLLCKSMDCNLKPPSDSFSNSNNLPRPKRNTKNKFFRIYEDDSSKINECSRNFPLKTNTKPTNSSTKVASTNNHVENYIKSHVFACKCELCSSKNYAFRPYKFVYAMHDDLDMFPRQAWLFLASSKFFGLKRHYENTDTQSNVNFDYGNMHTDMGYAHYISKQKTFSSLLSSSDSINESGDSENACPTWFTNSDSQTLNKIKYISEVCHRTPHSNDKTENTDHQYVCRCMTEKQNCKKSHILERLLGCSEDYMLFLLPTKEEKQRAFEKFLRMNGEEHTEFKLNVIFSKGWRDFIPCDFDSVLSSQINDLIPHDESETETNSDGKKCIENADEVIDWLRDEWFYLSKSDLVDIQSDIESCLNERKSSAGSRKRLTKSRKKI